MSYELWITGGEPSSTVAAISAVRKALVLLGEAEDNGLGYGPASDAISLLAQEAPILVGEAPDEEARSAAADALTAIGFEIGYQDPRETPEALETPYSAGAHLHIVPGAEPDPEGEPEAEEDGAWNAVADDVSRVALVLMSACESNPAQALHLATNLSNALGEDPDAPDAVFYEVGVHIASTFSGYRQAQLIVKVARAAGVHPDDQPKGFA